MSEGKRFTTSVCLFIVFGICPIVSAEYVSYVYDDFGRLKNASYDNGNTLSNIGYLYDNVGNFTNETITSQANLNSQLTFTPFGINFGTVYTGSLSNQTVTVTNTGSDGLSISGFSVGGTDKTLFQITSNTCNQSLIAGSSCNITLTTTPASGTPIGTKYATLDLTSNDKYYPLKSIALTSEVALPKLTVTKQNGGTGTVTSVPAGLSCGDTCSATFTEPTSVVLTAVADSGNTFVGWAGDCSGTISNCTISVSQSANVVAIFSKSGQNYAVNLTVDGSGSGSVLSTPSGIACNTNCSALYTTNSNVTLHPSASQYSIFSGWVTGDCSGTADCLLTMNSNKFLTAAFDKDVARQVAKITPLSYFTTIMTAYNAGNNGDVIKLWAQPYNENLLLNLPISITLQGGYDGSYTNITGEATIKGIVDIINGSVTVDGLVVIQ